MKVPWRGPIIRNVNHILKHRVITKLTLVLLGSLIPTGTTAATLSEQIQAAQAAMAAQQSQAAALHSQASNYRDRVASLQAQIRAMQAQINVSQLKYTRVTGQIEDAKIKMANQKSILARNIKTMYLDSGVTPIEMLASSNNLSDYFDQQQYQDKVKEKIQASLAEIQALKKKLEADQAEVSRLMADQKAQKDQLAAQQAEVNSLLAAASRSAAEADAQVAASDAQVKELKRQQAIELMRRFGSNLMAGGTCGGGYPARWCNVPQDSTVDNWGMYNRECVSYAAFKVAVSGRNMPYWGGRGNANQWDENARAAGLAVNGTPKAGAVAQTNAGPYGHVAYVEAVLPGGKVHISQYNYDGNGTYSEMTVPASSFNYIHF